jgi:hypothetical protein
VKSNQINGDGARRTRQLSIISITTGKQTYFSSIFPSFVVYFLFIFILMSFCSPLQITKAAVDIVRGLTGSEEGLHSLANQAKALIPALSRLLTAPKVKIHHCS